MNIKYLTIIMIYIALAIGDSDIINKTSAINAGFMHVIF